MQLSELQSRILARIGEDPTAPPSLSYYGPGEVTAALNAVQRIFVLLTLCLETTGSLITTVNVPFYQLLSDFPDLLLPLRVRLAGGAKVKFSRLADFAALDSAWSATQGVPERYALLGFDLLALYKAPNPPVTLNITYARCPAFLASSTDVPEIPPEYHPDLIKGAIPLLRAKEGGQEFEKTLPLWDEFMDAAAKLADFVRARNKEQGYDYMPAELRRIDRSRMLQEAVGK
jgi:hypothetical protein